MNLVWKLLKQHISIPQFVGFAFANLFGMLVILFGVQFYCDVKPVFTGNDSFMKSENIIVSKKVGTANSISSTANTFDVSEVEDLENQTFVRTVGKFTSSDYRVEASMGIAGTTILNSEIFFESIPDQFIDISLNEWKYTPGSNIIPIILPKSYIAMYNFGFAQSHSLPKISEGLASMINLRIFIQGNGHKEQYEGKVIGFSNRLSSILVPQSFMEWSNSRYSTSTTPNSPNRLIVDVKSPTETTVSQYMEDHGYDISDNNMNAERITSFLRLLVGIVVIVGTIISVLSFYILILSIYLLVQKNSTKLENLLLIGYSIRKVCSPYLRLAIGLNLTVLLIALGLLSTIRHYYMLQLQILSPNLENNSMLPAIILGGILFLLVSVLNIAIISRKIVRIWFRKE